MGINNPVPQNLGAESRKAAKILTSFVKPNQLLSYDQVIPPDVLRNAKGLVILTVLKAGFLFSGRAGSGIVVARLPDGSWSPPSAVSTAGAGVGGQIGAELTDFIFVLNNAEAVRVFSKAGQLTLGGNVSLAAGPLGRNAEAAGAATAGNVAAIFSYSKTKGLFAGVSLEGSAIIERREANRKFYGSNCTAKSILSGKVPPPRAVEPLFRVLESRAFSGHYTGSDFYDDMPSERDFDSDSGYRSVGGGGRYNDREDRYDRYERGGDRYSGGRDRYSEHYDRDREDRYDRYDEDRYDSGSRDRDRDRDRYDSGSRDRYGDRHGDRRGDRYDDRYDDDRYGDSHYERGNSSKATSNSAAAAASDPYSGGSKAVALFSFTGEQDGDLPFRKGDVITVTQRSGTTDDWWTGTVDGKTGIFPANYVELV